MGINYHKSIEIQSMVMMQIQFTCIILLGKHFICCRTTLVNFALFVLLSYLKYDDPEGHI